MSQEITEAALKRTTKKLLGKWEPTTHPAKQRQRDIAKWLIKGAEDMEAGLSRAKTPQNAARPYMRGAFSGDVPSRREVDGVAAMTMEQLLSPEP